MNINIKPILQDLDWLGNTEDNFDPKNQSTMVEECLYEWGRGITISNPPNAKDFADKMEIEKQKVDFLNKKLEVVASARNFMGEGKVGLEIVSALTKKFGAEQVKEASDLLGPVIREEQGILGCIAIDARDSEFPMKVANNHKNKKYLSYYIKNDKQGNMILEPIKEQVNIKSAFDETDCVGSIDGFFDMEVPKEKQAGFGDVDSKWMDSTMIDLVTTDRLGLEDKKDLDKESSSNLKKIQKAFVLEAKKAHEAKKNAYKNIESNEQHKIKESNLNVNLAGKAKEAQKFTTGFTPEMAKVEPGKQAKNIKVNPLKPVNDNTINVANEAQKPQKFSGNMKAEMPKVEPSKAPDKDITIAKMRPANDNKVKFAKKLKPQAMNSCSNKLDEVKVGEAKEKLKIANVVNGTHKEVIIDIKKEATPEIKVSGGGNIEAEVEMASLFDGIDVDASGYVDDFFLGTDEISIDDEKEPIDKLDISITGEIIL